MTDPSNRTERVLAPLRDPQGIHIESPHIGCTTIVFVAAHDLAAAVTEIETLRKERDEARRMYCLDTLAKLDEEMGLQP